VGYEICPLIDYPGPLPIDLLFDVEASQKGYFLDSYFNNTRPGVPIVSFQIWYPTSNLLRTSLARSST